MILQKGQILGEVLIAIALFTLVIFSSSLLIFDSFAATRGGLERTKATFLAREGLEAARSIKDNNFEELNVGEYGIKLLDEKWVFSGNSDKLGKYTRKILVEDDQSDDKRKRVVSQVNWSINPAREEKIELVTYLADNSISTGGSCPDYCIGEGYDDGICRQNANKCTQNDETYEEGGDEYCTGPAENVCCCQEISSCQDYCVTEGYDGGSCRDNWCPWWATHEEDGDEFCSSHKDTCCCWSWWNW